MADVDDLDQVIERCQRALNEFLKGNPEPNKAMSDYFWGLWSIVQYATDNPAADFWTSALNRFEHCKMLMRSADSDHCLNAVRTSY